MNPQITEEQLIAYALGEGDAEERAAVEAMLANDADARKLVDETRQLAAVASEALQADEASAMTAEQRDEVMKAAKDEKARTKTPWWRLSRLEWATVATIVAISAAVILPQAFDVNYRRWDAAEMARRLETPEDLPNFPPAEMPAGDEIEEGFDEFNYQQSGSASGGAPASRIVVGQEVPMLVGPAEEPAPAAASELSALGRSDAGAAAGITYQKMDPRQSVKADFSPDGSAGITFQEMDPRQNIKAEFSEEGFIEVSPEQFRLDWPGHNTEDYNSIVENPFLSVRENPLSTFSIDVDTASYSNMRRYLTMGSLPPKDAVRIEELVNYFSYDYAPPDGDDPFAAHIEVGECPWTPEHRLVRFGLKGWEMAKKDRPASNLVFLVDVSGSMQPENKLPLLKKGLRMLTRQLDKRDSVAMVVYAGSSGLVLPATSGEDRKQINRAINQLESGGSTNGGEGIELAYKIAGEQFVKDGVNRVILCTDGDFNVGTTDQGSLVRMIEEKAKSGVFLTVLGFGMGNLNDAMLEQLADKGNGNYAYIDTENEARKVLVEQMSGTLVTIAKDVKIQVEFNPARIGAYRLIGYENRMLKKEDFNDDTKDAGEIGAGHTVTALYEIVPAGQEIDLPSVDPLKYQTPVPGGLTPESDELLTLKLRYKQPDGDTSKLLEFPVKESTNLGHSSDDFRWAAAVAGFGMLLRGSEYKGDLDYATVLDVAQGAAGEDPDGYRAEFISLVQQARTLATGVLETEAGPENAPRRKGQ